MGAGVMLPYLAPFCNFSSAYPIPTWRGLAATWRPPGRPAPAGRCLERGGGGGDCPSPARSPGRGPHAFGPLCAPTAHDPHRLPNAALSWTTMVDSPSVRLSEHHVSTRRSPRHGQAMPAAACGGSDYSATIVPEPQGVVGVVCRGLGRPGAVVWRDHVCGLERQNMT